MPQISSIVLIIFLVKTFLIAKTHQSQLQPCEVQCPKFGETLYNDGSEENTRSLSPWKICKDINNNRYTFSVTKILKKILPCTLLTTILCCSH